LNLPFFIARRYLLRQKGTFSAFIIRLSIIATALSVAVMIVAVASVNGFKYTIKEKMYSMLGHIHVELFDQNNSQSLDFSPLKYDPHLAASIQSIPHVSQVSVFAIKPTIIKTKGEMEGIQLKGVNADYRFSEGIEFTGNKIDYSDSAYAKQIIISRSTADKLNAKAGDTVQLIFLDQNSNFPRIRKVTIAGLYHTGVENVDEYYGICDIRMIQRINNWTAGDINGYQVELDDSRYSDTVSSYIFSKYLNAPLTSYTIKELYNYVFDWLGLIDMNGRILLFIMAIVAVINLGAALMILIVDQSRMVGMMKALGMAPEKLRLVFLYYSGLIAGAGILLGNIVGGGLCWIQQKNRFYKIAGGYLLYEICSHSFRLEANRNNRCNHTCFVHTLHVAAHVVYSFYTTGKSVTV